MVKYIIKRFIMIIPTLFGITAVSFFLIQLAPGGPVEQKLQEIRFGNSGKQRPERVSPEVIRALEKQYGFDKPVARRYLDWLNHLVHFDFGSSFVYQRPAIDVILERAPVSVAFGTASFLITYLLAIGLGLVMAVFENRTLDVGLGFILVCLAAIPAFMLGVLLLVFFAGDTFLNLFPVGYVQSDNYEGLSAAAKIWDRLHHAVLPLICYVAGGFAVLAFLGRNSILEESRKDYARTARAKGLKERLVYAKHILRNSMIPLVTGLGGALAGYLSGSVLVESVFQINGLGLLSFQSVLSRDYNVLMALLVLSSLLLLVGNLLSDMIYAAVDPRIRFE